MRILLDQGTPVGVRAALRDHDVGTANAQGWSRLTNGDLLRAAEEAGFDVLITTDTNLTQQQNLHGRKLAVVILSQNRWSLVKTKFNEIAATVDSAKPGTFSIVDISV